MTTPGSVKNTRLPLGPVDRCPAVNATMATMKYIDTTMPASDMTGTSMSVSDMTMNAIFTTSGIPATTQATPASDDKPEPYVIKNMSMLLVALES